MFIYLKLHNIISRYSYTKFLLEPPTWTLQRRVLLLCAGLGPVGEKDRDVSSSSTDSVMALDVPGGELVPNAPSTSSG